MSEELIQKVRSVVAGVKHVPVESIAVDKPFQEIGVDSMDAVEILFALENEFDISIPDEDAKGVRNVREMAEGIQKLIAAKPADATAGQ